MTVDLSWGIQSRTNRRDARGVVPVVVGANTTNAEAIVLPFAKGCWATSYHSFLSRRETDVKPPVATFRREYRGSIPTAFE